LKRRPHRKSHGKIAFKDLAREVGKRWKALSDIEKSKYNDLAEKDLQRYTEQMKDYNSKRNRFAGSSYQTSPGPLPPQINHGTGVNFSTFSDDHKNLSSVHKIPKMSRGHMEQGKSSDLNPLDLQHPHAFPSVPMHYPHVIPPQAIDINETNFFLGSNMGVDVPPLDPHTIHYSMDQYHTIHAHPKQSHGGSSPSDGVGSASESGDSSALGEE